MKFAVPPPLTPSRPPPRCCGGELMAAGGAAASWPGTSWAHSPRPTPSPPPPLPLAGIGGSQSASVAPPQPLCRLDCVFFFFFSPSGRRRRLWAQRVIMFLSGWRVLVLLLMKLSTRRQWSWATVELCSPGEFSSATAHSRSSSVSARLAAVFISPTLFSSLLFCFQFFQRC